MCRASHYLRLPSEIVRDRFRFCSLGFQPEQFLKGSGWKPNTNRCLQSIKLSNNEFVMI